MALKPLRKKKEKELTEIEKLIEEYTPRTITHLKSGISVKDIDIDEKMKKMGGIKEDDTFLFSYDNSINKEEMLGILIKTWDLFLHENQDFFDGNENFNKMSSSSKAGVGLLSGLLCIKLLKKIKGLFSKKGILKMKDFFIKPMQKIIASITKMIKSAIGLLKKPFVFFKSLFAKARGMFSKVTSFIKGVGKAVMTTINWLKNPLKNGWELLKKTPQALKSLGGKTANAFKSLKKGKDLAKIGTGAKAVAGASKSVLGKLPLLSVVIASGEALYTLNEASKNGEDLAEADQILLKDSIQSWKDNIDAITGKDKTLAERGWGLLGIGDSVGKSIVTATTSTIGQMTKAYLDTYDDLFGESMEERRARIDKEVKFNLFKQGLLVADENGFSVKNPESLDKSNLRYLDDKTVNQVPQSFNVPVRSIKEFTKDPNKPNISY